MNINEIMKILPHRYPLLLVDKVLETNEDKIIAIKNVTINEPIFNGHFPDFPIYPGVYQIEGMAQAGALLAMKDIKDIENKTVFFMTIDKAKFRKPVVPGDVLTYEVKITTRKGTICVFEGKCLVDGQVVSSAILKAMVTNKN
jgi:beta-hydroxyacyl-ACP dehydratase FabZ